MWTQVARCKLIRQSSPPDRDGAEGSGSPGTCTDVPTLPTLPRSSGYERLPLTCGLTPPGFGRQSRAQQAEPHRVPYLIRQACLSFWW